MSLRTQDYHYDLPEELLATHPPAHREDARMLVFDRTSDIITHRSIRNLIDYIEPDDLTVLNNTRVIPARLFSEDKRIEIFLLEEIQPHTWVCMAKPGRKLKLGSRISVANTAIKVLEILENGERVIRFERAPDLEHFGSVPLPPYLARSATTEDKERYQTVYASESGAVAAPTAGLHFTQEMLEKIPHRFVTLHVGAGTFQPVKVDDITQHHMHEERYILTEETAVAINTAKRILAVGTTSVRVLETCTDEKGYLKAGEGRTDIFIYPPYTFKAVDRLLTNFHLPESTLLMLVSAMIGRERTLEIYREAVKERYRFYSYGDCMLIL